MLLLRAERLPEGPDWLYELKLDGYRAVAIKLGGVLFRQKRKVRQRTKPRNRPATMLCLLALHSRFGPFGFHRLALQSFDKLPVRAVLARLAATR
jgi:hypothetical protein